MGLIVFLSIHRLILKLLEVPILPLKLLYDLREGPFLFGYLLGSGTNQLTIGDALGQGPSQILANSGDSVINVMNSIFLQGGAGTGTPFCRCRNWRC